MHLHIPDGVLPAYLWAPALGVALALLFVASRRDRGGVGRHVAYRGAIAALALAAMAVEIPLGPLEYHVTLIGPIGVLLGVAGSFQVIFLVNAILALIGHGGFTVVGLNALVLGAGAALARPTYRRLARRWAPGPSLAAAAALAQLVSGALWLAVLWTALRLSPGAAADPVLRTRAGLVAALAFPMALIGLVAESAVAFGTGRFLARVRPDLLPAIAPAAAPAVGPEAA